jgi:predicted phage terminase large subunit-like protein
MLDTIPNDIVAWCRNWDLTATEPSESNPNPDFTCGVLMGRRKNGRLVVVHVEFARVRSDPVRQLIRSTAENDGHHVKVRLPQDPGQAGVDQKNSYVKLLDGFTFTFERETGAKETRADNFSSQWQHGNVDVVRGAWNGDYFSQMEGFPSSSVKDDAVDASAGADTALDGKLTMAEAYEEEASDNETN